MTRFFSILAVALAVGCASQPTTTSAPPAAKKLSDRRVTAEMLPEAPPKARVLPVNGRIASVNEKLRFVVIDFTNSRRPEIDQRLNVYRVGQKVAEIKVSGPFRNTTVAADVVAGEVKYGDEVKTE